MLFIYRYKEAGCRRHLLWTHPSLPPSHNRVQPSTCGPTVCIYGPCSWNAFDFFILKDNRVTPSLWFLNGPTQFGRPGKFALLGCFLFQVLTLGTHAYATLINHDILSYSDNESWNLLICIPQFSKRKLLVSTVVR